MEPGHISDHLFRHQYGKMVSTLTRIFGFEHHQIIEDAVQDTFLLALKKWRTAIPDHPEAWLMHAAKQRSIDLFRHNKALTKREEQFTHGSMSLAIDQLFLDHEVEDSQLRLIYAICHPALKAQDQLSLALKMMSGFSNKEIAKALMLKEETVKKRITRAKKFIVDQAIRLEIPLGEALLDRTQRVLEVIYLLFNEGFHSSGKTSLIREELCGEALRLCKMILKKEYLRNANVYCLFGLLCLHAARLEGKVDQDGQLIPLKEQDRRVWHKPLLQLGLDSLAKSAQYEDHSPFAFEAAIALEHTKAKSFEETDWKTILNIYQQSHKEYPNEMNVLSQAVIHIQLGSFAEAEKTLSTLNQAALGSNIYLFHAVKAELLMGRKKIDEARVSLETAISLCSSDAEIRHLRNKLESY